MPSPPEITTIEKDLTQGDPIRSRTVDELKARLGNRDIVSERGMIPEAGEMVSRQCVAGGGGTDEQGLIVPRKPLNPCIESPDRQLLHRELMFNQRIGRSVLNQKSELQRALQRHKENQAKQLSASAPAPELEQVIADRAKRLQEPAPQHKPEAAVQEVLLQARAKLRTRNDSK